MNDTKNKGLVKSTVAKKKKDKQVKPRIEVLGIKRGVECLSSEPKSSVIHNKPDILNNSSVGGNEKIKPPLVSLFDKVDNPLAQPIDNNSNVLQEQRDVRADNFFQKSIKGFKRMFKREPSPTIKDLFLQPERLDNFLVELGDIALLPPEIIKMSVVNFFNCFSDEDTCTKLLCYGYGLQIQKARNFSKLIMSKKHILKKELNKK